MNAVQMVSKLIDARDAARNTLGDRYTEEIIKTAAMVKAVAAARNIEPFTAALRMAREARDNTGAMLLLFATMVELTEPSPGVVIP